ncbi:hypothetical protein ACM66B_001457 [Microbotryomycetes sp. NB124-2]
MSEGWNEASRQLLPVPWTRFPASNSDESSCLLVKTLLLKGSSLQFAVLATDLETSYIEVLDQRQLVHRVRTSLQESQDSQSQSQYGVVGYNADGEHAVRSIAQDIMHEVASGAAAITFTQKGYNNTLHVTLTTGLTMQFVLDGMDDKAAACLSTHLVIPLLGLSSALLGLLKDMINDKDEFTKQIEDAVDSSGSIERSTGGRACKTFFKNGGGSVLRRWCERRQRGPGKELEHIQLSSGSLAGHATAANSQAPATTNPRNRSPSSSSSTKRHPIAGTSATPSKSRAKQMLNHRAPLSSGEAVGWDESQKMPEPSKQNGRRSPLKRTAETEVDSDDEPDTENENEARMPPATQRSSTLRRPPACSVHENDSFLPSPSNRTERVQSPNASRLPPSSISPPLDDLEAEGEGAAADKSESEDEEIIWQRQQQEKERKKQAAQAEEQEARLQTLMRAKAAAQKKSAAMARGRGTTAKKQKRL